jgi:hypothetical protein
MYLRKMKENKNGRVQMEKIIKRKGMNIAVRSEYEGKGIILNIGYIHDQVFNRRGICLTPKQAKELAKVILTLANKNKKGAKK